MTDFNRASKGLSKIFKGEILNIIAYALFAIIAVVAAAAVAVVGTSTEEEIADALVNTSEAGVIAGGIGLIVIIIACAVIAVIAYILKLSGMGTAGSQNSKIKAALVAALISLALTIVGLALSNASYSDIIQTAKVALDAVVTILVLMGCSELLSQKGDTELAEKAGTVMMRVIIAFVLSAILRVIPTFTDGIIDSILVIASAVCSIIAFIQYLIIVKKASKSLAE